MLANRAKASPSTSQLRGRVPSESHPSGTLVVHRKDMQQGQVVQRRSIDKAPGEVLERVASYLWADEATAVALVCHRTLGAQMKEKAEEEVVMWAVGVDCRRRTPTSSPHGQRGSLARRDKRLALQSWCKRCGCYHQ